MKYPTNKKQNAIMLGVTCAALVIAVVLILLFVTDWGKSSKKQDASNAGGLTVVDPEEKSASDESNASDENVTDFNDTQTDAETGESPVDNSGSSEGLSTQDGNADSEDGGRTWGPLF